MGLPALLASNGRTSTWRFEIFSDSSPAALRLAADYIADSCASTNPPEQPARVDIRTLAKNTRVLSPDE